LKDHISVVVWNIQFKTRASWQGREIRTRIAACEPDIVCITEGHPDFLDLPHRVEAIADHGYPNADDRRKVLLWSRERWAGIDQTGDIALPTGRYISAQTSTALGEVAVHGLCIPWRDAHVRTGRRDSAPWTEHVRYLRGLARILATTREMQRVVVLGDYNQRLPRRHAPERVHAEFIAAFPPTLRCATTGVIAPLGRRSIDHLHHGSDLAVVSVKGLCDTDADGRLLSDHFGIHVELRAVRDCA